MRKVEPYKTDEGSNVGPAVLHQWEWTITNHVCDVVVKAVRTFRVRKDNRKVSLTRLFLAHHTSKFFQEHNFYL